MQDPAKEWIAEELGLTNEKQRPRKRRLEDDRIRIRKVIRGDQERAIVGDVLHADESQLRAADPTWRGRLISGPFAAGRVTFRSEDLL